MKKLAILALALVVVTPAAADGCPPSQCGVFSSVVPGSRFLQVRTNGEHGPLRVYDVLSGRHVTTLGRGMPSADGRRFVTVKSLRKGTTHVTTYALPNAAQLSMRELSGRLGLAAVSRSGTRIVLWRAGGPRRTTTFVVLDRGAIAHTVRLSGAYELETLSPDGNRLFLIHWRSNSYELETYNLLTRRLRPTVMLEDGRPEDLVGQAWRGIATRDGRWLLTLYLKGRGAFIHALDLERGVGHCVDLPAHAEPLTLGSSGMGLAFTPDGRKLVVLGGDGNAVTLDAATGRRVR